MKRIQLLTFFIVVMAVLGCRDKTATKLLGSSNDQKPNIIYILADDLGYGDLGVYGQTKIETPHIDALAATGMLFTQHYSGAPVCAPARASLLTGLHGGQASIRGNDEWEERGDVWNYNAMINDSTLEGQRPMPKNTVTVAQLLKSANYKTAIVGKWGLGAPHTYSIPTKMGFDYFFGYNCQRLAHTYTPVFLYENENRYWLKNDTIAPHFGLLDQDDPLAMASYAKYTQPGYAPELMFDKMMAFIEANKNDPFFVYWASPIPHVPLQAPKKWMAYYVDKFDDEDPYYFKKERGSYFPTRYPRATYAAMISYLDENIGKLVAYLKEEGLYDNTLIIFTSDNGPASDGGTDPEWFNSGGILQGQTGRGKGHTYEGGIRVPMIASWPAKIQAGSTSDHISAFYDVMPTFNDIAQVPTPVKTDGISFYNVLTNKADQQEAHEYLYWEFAGYGGQVAVRKGQWKMIWRNIKNGNTDLELYDLATDVREEHNLIDQHPEMRAIFYDIIRKEHTTPENSAFIIEALEAL